MQIDGLAQNETDSAGAQQLANENEKEVPADLANERPCGVAGLHNPHSWRVPGGDYATCPGVAADEPIADDLGTYDAMFATYRHEQRHWIGPAQAPLVFHIAKLCRKLDADPDAPASLSSAYLQAIQRLDRQRPGNTQPAGAAGDLPGQGSIFDELD